MSGITLIEAGDLPSTQDRAHNPFPILEEGEFIYVVEFERVRVVKGASPIFVPKVRIRDVIVRLAVSSLRRFPGKQSGIEIEQLRPCVPELELQTVAEALLEFCN